MGVSPPTHPVIYPIIPCRCPATFSGCWKDFDHPEKVLGRILINGLVYHGSEVAFVFGIPIALELGYNATSAAGVTNIPNYTEQDAELSVQMIDYW